MPDTLRVNVRVEFQPGMKSVFGSPQTDGMAALTVLHDRLVESLAELGFDPVGFKLNAEVEREQW